MVEESPQTPAPHRRSLLAGLLSFIPALALYASSLLSAHPVVVLALLAGSAWMLTAICAGIGFAMERDFLRSVIRRGSVSFFMLVLHTSFMALVLAGPVWWLLDEPSLLGALLLSAALLVALLVPWRIWPALTWPLIVVNQGWNRCLRQRQMEHLVLKPSGLLQVPLTVVIMAWLT